MHVFLIGDKGCGKSWAVRRAAELLGRPCFGFITRFEGPDRHSSSLYLLPASAPEQMDKAHLAACWQDGKLQPVPGVFDTLGAALLAEARMHPEGLILMDECGRIEKDAMVFRQEILCCLDGNIPVLGVLRRDQPWHEFIKAHPYVRVLTLTERASEFLPGQIVKELKESI